MGRPCTHGGRLGRPLHGGVPAVRALVREFLSDYPDTEAADCTRALGMAEAVCYFAPAAGRRLREEVMQVLHGERNGRTWRPRRPPERRPQGGDHRRPTPSGS